MPLPSRLALLLAVLLTLTPVAFLTPSPAAAYGKSRTTLTISAPSGAPSGKKVTVAGRLVTARGSRPVKGQRITVQRRDFGVSQWRRIARVTTDRQGRFRTRVVLRSNTNFRAVYHGSRSRTPDVSNIRSVRPRQRLSVTNKPPKRIDGGEPFTLRGKATPGLESARVFLQRRLTSGRWRNFGSSTVDKKLRYSVTGSIQDGSGGLTFRTSTNKTRTELPAASKPVRIAFSGWYRLASLRPAEPPATDPATINFALLPRPVVAGRRYADSYASRTVSGGFSDFQRGAASFNLAQQCSALTSTIGLGDDAGASSAWQFGVRLDGNETNYGYLEPGQTLSVSEDLVAVGVLTLSNTRRVTPPDSLSQRADAVWAGARLKCDQRPE